MPVFVSSHEVARGELLACARCGQVFLGSAAAERHEKACRLARAAKQGASL